MQARKISRFALRMLILDLEKHVKEVIDTEDADLIEQAAGALNDLIIVHRQLTEQDDISSRFGREPGQCNDPMPADEWNIPPGRYATSI